MSLEENALRAPGDGGIGFCYDVDRDLFRGADGSSDGPLLIALDSNIIFDLEQHGRALLEEDHIDGIDDAMRDELEALGKLLDIWFMRDIRFIITPRTRKDFRKDHRRHGWRPESDCSSRSSSH